MPTWIDFKELREKLRFEQVLRYYGVEVIRKGEQHQGRCPVPGHGAKNDSLSFSANLERGIFQCFGCGAKGNVLEFAMLMEKVSLTDGRAFRGVAVKLQRELCPDLVSVRPWKGKPVETKQPPQSKPAEVFVNVPLDFELKGLNGDHPCLKEKNLTRETIDYFGLGFCSRGSLRDQIAIPLRNNSGALIGYAGEAIDESLVPSSRPRYSYPVKRERDGNVLGFDRSLFLYNGFRIEAPADELIIAGDFASVWWLLSSAD